MPTENRPQYVTVHAPDYFTCLCGNEPWWEGFPPCDKAGSEVDPDQNWNPPLLVCDRCGLILDAATGRIVSKRA